MLTGKGRVVGSSPSNLPTIGINTPALLTPPTALHGSEHTNTEVDNHRMTDSSNGEERKRRAEVHVSVPSHSSNVLGLRKLLQN